MKKNIFKFTFFIILISVASFLLSMIYRKIENKKVVTERIKTLSKVQLIGIDNQPFMFESADVYTVLLFFNSECDHCQNEAVQIKKNLHLFTKARITFISTEPLETIKNFAKKYELNKIENIRFGHTESNQITKEFGVVSFPTIFIYDKKGILVKQYKGETKIEAITKFINQ